MFISKYTLNEINDNIRKEKQHEIATFNLCECGRRAYKYIKCSLCWEEEKDKILRNGRNEIL